MTVCFYESISEEIIKFTQSKKIMPSFLTQYASRLLQPLYLEYHSQPPSLLFLMFYTKFLNVSVSPPMILRKVFTTENVMAQENVFLECLVLQENAHFQIF